MKAEMSAQEREQVRLSLLRYLDRYRFGLALPVMVQLMGSEGFRVEAEQVEQELDYLVDKGLVAPVAKVLSPENKTWRVTAEGRDFVAQG